MSVSLVVVGFATPKTVTVNMDDSVEVVSTTYETTAMRVDSFIETHQIDYVYGQDIIDVEYYDRITDDMEINIKKAASIPVTADGETVSVTTQPITVKEIIDAINEIVPMIQFLSDIEKARFIVGQVICVDGGQTSDGSIESMNFTIGEK